MRKNNSFLRLMTIFLSVIGLSAAALSGYILIYSHLSTKSSGKDDFVHSSEIATAQVDNNTNDISSASPDPTQNQNTLSDYQEPENEEPEYISISQEPLDDLTENMQMSEEQDPSISEQEPQKNSVSVQSTSEITDPLQNTQDSFSPEQSIPESNYQDNTDPNFLNSSGNADNFNTYYNPHLQQTTDNYVLNTNSKVFHIPECNDVAKMAEKNYTTSNASYTDIEAQGYRPCGHCLKDYPYGNSGNYTENSDLQQQTTNTTIYIINKDTGYFHLPNGCKYINEYSKPEDCITTNSSIDELRSQNYKPCKHCGL